MGLELSVRQAMGELKIPEHMFQPSVKIVHTEKKKNIVHKCYAHIMNNGRVGMSKKNKSKDSQQNIILIFDGNTKELLRAEKLELETD